MMLTMAAKIKTKKTTVKVIRGGSVREVCDRELSEAIREAHELWKKSRELEAALARAKALIAGRAEGLMERGATVSLEADGVRCTVTVRHEAVVPEENVTALRKLLGRRFRDLVRCKVQHMASSRLVAEATEEVLSLISLRKLSPQFKWSGDDAD